MSGATPGGTPVTIGKKGQSDWVRHSLRGANPPALVSLIHKPACRVRLRSDLQLFLDSGLRCGHAHTVQRSWETKNEHTHQRHSDTSRPHD